MKKIIGGIIAILLLNACASDNLAYKKEQFSTSNYEKNIINILLYTDNFVDFDKTNIPNASLEGEDLAVLLQADMAFNQGEYVKAAPAYYYLADKYRDPRIIYKGIICYENFFNIASHDIARLNQLISLLTKAAPNSNVTRLFSIRINVENNNLDKAKDGLKSLINENQQRARSILLILATIFTSDYDKKASTSLDQFALYVANKYAQYPEAYLFAAASYSIAGDKPDLLATFRKISTNYPTWEIPLYWCAGILFDNGNLQLLLDLLEDEIQITRTPSRMLENLYVATLIRTNKLEAANTYIATSLPNSPHKGSLLVNLGIVNYRLGNNPKALTALIAAKNNNFELGGVVDFAIANLYDYNHQYESAISYYKQAAANNQLNRQLIEVPANMAIFKAYVNQGQYQAANDFLEQVAKKNKLGIKDANLVKINLYTALGKYDIAYNLLSTKINSYARESDFVYLYASLSGFTRHIPEAIKWYKKYIQMAADNASGYNDLAFVLVENTREYKTAKIYAEKAYALAPKDPAVEDTIGWVYYKLKDYNKAREYLENAYQQTHDPETAMHLKTVYAALGMQDKAGSIIIPSKEDARRLIEQNVLNQAIMILVYYQYGLDLKQ